MAKIAESDTLEITLGKLIGSFDALKEQCMRLNGDLKQHIRDHKAGVLWLIPTFISLSTFALLLITYLRH